MGCGSGPGGNVGCAVLVRRRYPASVERCRCGLCGLQSGAAPGAGAGGRCGTSGAAARVAATGGVLGVDGGKPAAVTSAARGAAQGGKLCQGSVVLGCGVVKECSIITDRSFPARAPAAWSSIVEANAGAVPVSVRLGQVHSKLFFLRAGERHIVCGGSSNWNLVRRVEDFCIEENRALYDDFMVIWDRLWGAAGAVDVPPVGAVRYMRPLVDLSKERGGLTAPPVPKLDVV